MNSTKEQGIQKVIDNNHDDHMNILVFAREWLKKQINPFTADDLRLKYESTNLAPKQPKIYGGVFNTLVKEKLIQHEGVTTSKRPEAHSRLIRTWKSLCVSEELKSA